MHIPCVGRGPWVPVADDDVVQPVWHDALCVHQVPDRLQHGLEVVLLRLAPHHHVERLIRVLRQSKDAKKRCQKLSGENFASA